MRTLSAIVLLLWAVCYGRCLAEQCGALSSHQVRCCSEDCGQSHDKTPALPCGVCAFVQHGGALPSDPLVLDVPVLFSLLTPQIYGLVLELRLLEIHESGQVAENTEPPPLRRLCEWMASTAMPVRGPTARA